MSPRVNPTAHGVSDSNAENPAAEYRYIFGPVPSRRLGVSLGVDLMPHKTCSLDCVYCECGRTIHLTIKPDEYVPLAVVKKELAAYLSSSPRLDYVTFSGSGEPTLHSGIGEVVRFIKNQFPQYRIALLTNGTLLGREEVQEKLLDIDVVIVSVDAASGDVFSKVNRPHPELELDTYIEGVVSFRKRFQNSLWVEVFLVPGVNTSVEELGRIRTLIQKMKPDKVQVNTLDRPGAEAWVVPVAAKELEKAVSFLQTAEVVPAARGDRMAGANIDLAGRILGAVRRRPMTLEDISGMFGVDADTAGNTLGQMEQNKVIRRLPMPRGIFFLPEKE